MKCPFCIKVCTKCNRILVAYSGNFNKQKGGKYGLLSICKECGKAYQKQYYQDNIEKIKEYDKQNADKIKAYYKAYSKQYYQDNIDKCRAYYQDNIDKIKSQQKEYDKKYYRDNIDKCKARSKQQWDKYLADNGLERGQGSYGEQLVRKALQDKGIEFVEQHSFTDCKYKSALRYDFYIPSLNTVIEYDGIQHFEPVDAFGGEERFKENKIRDEIKETYCKEHNITLIRIPYYDIDNVETIIAMLI